MRPVGTAVFIFWIYNQFKRKSDFTGLNYHPRSIGIGFLDVFRAVSVIGAIDLLLVKIGDFLYACVYSFRTVGGVTDEITK